jgi:outer membrane protein assembly factor BamB
MKNCVVENTSEPDMLANKRLSRFVALIGMVLFLQAETLVAQVRSQDALLDKPVVAMWQTPVAGMNKFTPVYFENTIYAASNDATISAIGKLTGEQVWRTEVGGEISTSLVADDKGVYVATRKLINIGNEARVERIDGSLRCLGTISGLTQWVIDFPLPLVGNLAVGKTHLFSFNDGNALFAFDKTSGSTAWSVQLDARFATNILTQNDLLFIGAENNILYALDQQTGKTVWKKTVNSASKINNIASDGRRVYVSTGDNRVSALDITTGTSIWRKKYSGAIKSLLTGDNRIIIATANNVIYCLEFSRGRRVWKRELPGRIAGSPAITRDAILIANVTGEDCVVLRISNGRIINTISVGANFGLILQPLIARDTVVISTERGMIGYAPIRESPAQMQ